MCGALFARARSAARPSDGIALAARFGLGRMMSQASALLGRGQALRDSAVLCSWDVEQQGSTRSSCGSVDGSAPPQWLRKIRSAHAIDDSAGTYLGDVAKLQNSQHFGEHEAGSKQGLTYVQCIFTSPLSPRGPRVVVERALVDTGSSDCELRAGLIGRLPALPIITQGAVYETATGGEAFDAYEVLLTVEGRTAAVVVTACDEYSSDDALVGHMALGAMGLSIDCVTRRLVDHAQHPIPLVKPDGEEQREFGCHSLRAVGPIQSSHACAQLMDWWHAAARIGLNASEQLSYGCWHGEDVDGTTHEPAGQDGHLQGGPRWIRLNSCAVAIEGFRSDPEPLSLGITQPSHAPVQTTYATDEGTSKRGTLSTTLREVIPVTYVQCVFSSPLNPHGVSIIVEQALVDTGAADCELREGFARKLWPLPVVACGVVYETVSGRETNDCYEVLLTVQGRTCAAVVTITPEERFAADAEDPNSDEAVIGFAALAALRLLVDCRGRCVQPRSEVLPSTYCRGT